MNRAQQSRLFELADLILAVSRHIHAAKESQAVAGTPMEGAVMRYVDRHPGTSAGAAAEATQLISSNFSRAVRGLEAKGLLRREADEYDARRVRLYPTDAAAANLANLRDIWSRLLDGVVGDRAEVEAGIAALRRIESGLLAREKSTPSSRP